MSRNELGNSDFLRDILGKTCLPKGFPPTHIQKGQMHPSDDKTKEVRFFTPGICCLGGRPSCVQCGVNRAEISYSAGYRGVWKTLRLCTFNTLNQCFPTFSTSRYP